MGYRVDTKSREETRHGVGPRLVGGSRGPRQRGCDSGAWGTRDREDGPVGKVFHLTYFSCPFSWLGRRQGYTVSDDTPVDNMNPLVRGTGARDGTSPRRLSRSTILSRTDPWVDYCRSRVLLRPPETDPNPLYRPPWRSPTVT